MSKPTFTVDWEPWFCHIPYGEFWKQNCPQVDEPTEYLLDLLRRHEIRAVFYCLGWLIDKRPKLFKSIQAEGHAIGKHTYYHTYEPSPQELSDPLFRSPRFVGQKRLYAGGFFLRSMPYGWLKRKVLREGSVYVHPHDILWEHPRCDNPLQNWKRQVGLRTSRDKLERLCREVEFANPLS